MRIESLKYFVVTADCRSMTLSSKVLHVSQQCISREIKQLEAEMGRPLFWRSKAGVALTEDGELAYQKAQQILQDFADFGQLFQTEVGRKLTIGAYIGFKQHIDSVNNIFQRTHSQIAIEEYYSSTEQLVHALSSGTVDFALWQLEKEELLTLGPQTVYTPIILLEESVQILLSATPANAELKYFELSKLDQYPIMFYCDSAQETPLYQRIAQRYCDHLNVLYKGNNMEKSWNVFERRNAIAFMTKSLTGMVQNNSAMRLVPIDQKITVCTVLSVRNDLLDSAEIEELIDIFKAFFQQFI